ncbi:MAG: hypothetical protein VW080_11710 [Flavobacteriaceae bacterium]
MINNTPILVLFSFFIVTVSFGQRARDQFLKDQMVEQKDQIHFEERELLKNKIKEVNQQLYNDQISEEEANRLKMQYAKETAQKIDERSLEVEMEVYDQKVAEAKEKTAVGKSNWEYRRPRRENQSFVSSDAVFGFGLNNLVGNDFNLEETDYEYIKSLFFELGWSWKTNLIPDFNYFNVRYGFSFQFNSLSPSENRIFYNNGGQTDLKTFPTTLKRNKLIYTNLVFPIHLELGSRYRQHIIYEEDGRVVKQSFNRNSLIFGGGVYGGFNIHHIQRLKSELGKEKEKLNLDFNDLVYGLSGYVSLPRLFTLYGKYDFSPLFKNQLNPQNTISLGIRFDIN